jgi:5-methyltetrahydropteroyltriglutamate--homocysteine methyltransferase
MPTARHDPPFRAEHIGSFLRPPELRHARSEHAAGRLPAAALRAAEDKAIREVVALQERIGLRTVTDGEYRRGTYSENFTTEGLSGVRAEHVAGDWAYQDVKGNRVPARLPVVHARIHWQDSKNAADFTFLKGLATAAMPKITLPGPCYLHYRAGRQNISREVYPRLEDFWNDLIAAYAVELKKLAEAGCRYLQLDETSLAKLGDPKIREALATRGDDWQALLATYTDVTNAVVAAAPAGMRIGTHLCRGNNQGHWQAAGGYDVIAETLFRKLNIDFFFLEYDSPRAGSFEPLRMVPDDKVVVLGLVSTKVAELETEELLRARLAEAQKYISLDRLALSPQCGFASSHEGNRLSVEQEIAKLKRVVEVADKVWNGK